MIVLQGVGARVFDLDTLECKWQVPLEFEHVASLSFGPFPGVLAVGSWDGSVRVFDPTSFEMVHATQVHQQAIEQVKLSSAGGCVLSACNADGSFRAIDMVNGRALWKSEAYVAPDDPWRGPPCIDELADMAAMDMGGGVLRVVELEKGRQVARLRGLDRNMISVLFSPGGRSVAATDRGGYVRVWELPSGKLRNSFHVRHQQPRLLAVSGDADRVVTADSDKFARSSPVRVWNGRTGELRGELLAPPHNDFAFMVMLPGERYAITTAENGPVCLWDLDSYALMYRWQVKCSYDSQPVLWKDWAVVGSEQGEPVLLGPLSELLESRGQPVPEKLLEARAPEDPQRPRREPLVMSREPDWNWAYCRTLVQNLERSEIPVDPGLTDAEFEAIEAKWEFVFPPDLRQLLSLGVPVGERFPDWRNGKDADLAGRLSWPFEGMCADIEHNSFWMRHWGERPRDLGEAIEVARSYMSEAPVLIPVYGNRYIAATPELPGNRILRVHLTDVIYYADDLAEFFSRDFMLPSPRWIVEQPRKVPVWHDVIYS